MSAENKATVAVQASGIDVKLTAEPVSEGVECDLTCNGQKIIVIFTGADVMVDVASAASGSSG